MGSVATSLPLAIDHPIDAGIARFCDTCRACRRYSPAHAIPDHRSPDAGKDHLGHERYVVDTGRCFPYFAKHNYCSICLPVCVYNHKEWARDFEGAPTRLFPTVVMDDPPAPVDLANASATHTYVRLQR
jgi:epoxyqueuosine reductase QueG